MNRSEIELWRKDVIAPEVSQAPPASRAVAQDHFVEPPASTLDSPVVTIKTLSSRISNFVAHMSNVVDYFTKRSSKCLAAIPEKDLSSAIGNADQLAMNRSGVSKLAKAECARLIAEIPESMRARILSTVRELIAQREGNFSEVVAFLRAVVSVPVARIDRVRQGLDPHMSVLRLAGLMQANTNQGDPYQVHRAWLQVGRPIYLKLTNDLVEQPALPSSTTEKLKTWIKEADFSEFATNSEEQEVFRAKLMNFLGSWQFEAALKYNLPGFEKPSVSGQELLTLVVNFCDQHPEFIPVLLHQGLYDSLIAYVDRPDPSLAQISCIKGIAERFLLSMRQLAGKDPSEAASEMVQNVEYQQFLSMGIQSVSDSERHQWQTKYKNIRTMQDLQIALETELKDIKNKLAKQIEQKYGATVADEAYQQAFLGPMEEDSNLSAEQVAVVWRLVKNANQSTIRIE